MTTSVYDTTPAVLEAAVRELAAKRLPKIAGYQFNVHHRVFLVQLDGGAWVANAERSRERLEVLQEISYDITEAVLLTLTRLLPGKKWECGWGSDVQRDHYHGATVMSFRWRDRLPGESALPFPE